MSGKPKIYGYCPAGCKWETVHKEDFLNAATYFKVPLSEDKFYYLELGKQYKIFAGEDDDYTYKFVIRFAYMDNGTRTLMPLSITRNDKYAKHLVFKLLEASVNEAATSLTLVYEMAGVRYTETFTGTNISLIDENYLYVQDADRVYLYNDEASFSAVLDNYYDKSEIEELINNSITTALNTEV